MLRRLTPLALVVAIASAVTAAERVLLHENGGVFVGEVREEAGRYFVRGDGTEVQFPAAQVRFVGHSRDEVYAWVARQVPADQVSRRIGLTEWCIRQRLWTAAEHEVARLQAMASQDERIDRLARRLELARIASQRPPGTVTSVDPAVKLASAETPLATQVGGWDLAALPAGTLEEFTRRVQPILVNNCTTSGCHRVGGEQSFALHRELLFGGATRRHTQENLAAVLAAIDRDAPETSPLVAALRAPHGPLMAPPFVGRRAELQQRVEAWIERARSPQAPTSAPVQETGVVTAEYLAPLDDWNDAERAQAAAVEAWAANEERALQPTPKAPQYGLRLKSPAPKKLRDEFDPAEFNATAGDRNRSER